MTSEQLVCSYLMCQFALAWIRIASEITYNITHKSTCHTWREGWDIMWQESHWTSIIYWSVLRYLFWNSVCTDFSFCWVTQQWTNAFHPKCALFHFILEKAHIRELYICNFSKCLKYLRKVHAYAHIHMYKHTQTHSYIYTHTQYPNSEWYSYRSMGLPVTAKLALPSMSTLGWP